MKILYVTSEASPFAASGGLGDVMGALPPVIASAREDVSCDVILPLYKSVKEQYRKDMKKVADISFYLSWRKTGASIYILKWHGVNYYFVENHYYFDRDRLYGEGDDGERFAFFSLAVLEFLRVSKTVPDILHANDWQCALSVIYLKTELSHIPELQSIRTVFTIHNIEYQGKFDPYILGDVFGLDNKYYSIVEWDGCINLMKGALTVSDFVSTVSPSYAKELCYDYFSFGLSPMIQSISDKFVGILNGIDYEAFSPENGLDIYRSYGVEDRKEGKAYNKRELQRELGLPEREDVPLIAMITRLTAGKGVDLVLHVMDSIMSEDVQFVLLGTGDAVYEQAFSAFGDRHSAFKPLIRFDRGLSKKIYAAADIFLMPSKSEPCGLAQMIACSYGTLPLVRSVGGLHDSIRPMENGFVFSDFNAHQMLDVLQSALKTYRDKKCFDALSDRAKKSDFSWQRSAGEYLDMYDNLVK
ncbi:MAG: glycogen synthase [Clostridia bacterium]|nr:glycogen synthase [Clostridia bacterium]